MTVRDELQARALFEQRYGVAAAPVAVEIERRAIGGDWGAVEPLVQLLGQACNALEP
jgi:hypothetical protein